MKKSKSFLLLFTALILAIPILSQNIIKNSSSSPKLILGAVVNYNYVVGTANGDVNAFSIAWDENSGNGVFNSSNLGMQQGGGLSLYGKHAINRKRNLFATGEIGYNMFYNTGDGGANRTRWNIFNIAAGLELNHKSTPRNKVFIGFQVQYSLIYGSWQTNYTYPDNSTSNLYFKFKPASRLGLSIGSGMEFKTGKKSFFVVGVKGVWANLFPKSNNSSGDAYSINMNDASNSNGINLENKKEIIYLQLFTGINFSMK